jgi:DNA-binding NarL/FixJ family response regulator
MPDSENINSLEALCRAWQADVLDHLKDGLGVEDIALKMEYDVQEVRFEVNRLRKNGILDAAFRVV